MLEENLNVVENEQEQEFVIDDVQKAMWAINKIKEHRKEKDFYVDACKKEIERLKEEISKSEDKCENNCSWLMHQLDQYMNRDDVPSKTTKTQTSLKLPNGKIVRKLPQLEIVDEKGNSGAKLKDNQELIDFVGEQYVKVSKVVDWAEFKKHLVIQDDLVMTDDGEIVDFLSIRETLPSVDVKIEEEE